MIRRQAISAFQSFFLPAILLAGVAAPACGLNIVDHYSPRNGERPTRKATTAIILHTTEGPAAGSLKKLHQNGEAHYMVDTNGRVYRIIHRDRVAYHCGRSMWDATTDMDRYTIGIEVVGYHHRDISAAQYAALKELLSQIQGIYRIPDERVLTHSMVAYGTPNRWHRASHRGRKRCAMLFATRAVRERLGLTRGPLQDPDVRDRRLVVADTYLADVLYGDARKQASAAEHFTSDDRHIISRGRSAWDIARDAYNNAGTRYIFPDGSESRGDQIRDWTKLPAGTRVALSAEPPDNPPEGVKVLGEDGSTAWEVAGSEHRAKHTLYFLPGGQVRAGDSLSDVELRSLPVGTRLLVGYTHSGRITARKSAFQICGPRWNLPTTYYQLPDGALVDGSSLDERGIPAGTLVFLAH